MFWKWSQRKMERSIVGLLFIAAILAWLGCFFLVLQVIVNAMGWRV